MSADTVRPASPTRWTAEQDIANLVLFLTLPDEGQHPASSYASRGGAR